MARIRPSLVFAVLVLAAIGVLGALTEASADSGRYQAAPAAGPRKDTPGTTADGWVQTPYGPLGPADRDLLVKVRQAGLWEMPMGELAQTRGTTELVRQAGSVLMNDHMELDVKVRAVAAQLGVPLPDQPNADQQGWMAEIQSKNGVDFDRTWANRLRAAHGKVFIAIAQIRSGTRNTVIRGMAQTANTFVMRHMTVLENTGMVDYGALPTAPAPAAPAAAATQPALANNEIRTGAFGPMKSATVFLVVVVLLVIAGSVAIDRGPGKAKGRLRALFTTSGRRRTPLDVISSDDSDGSRGKRGRGQHHE